MERFVIKRAGFKCARENQPCPGCEAQRFASDALSRVLRDGNSKTKGELEANLKEVAQAMYGGTISSRVAVDRKGSETEPTVFLADLRVEDNPCKDNGAGVLVWADRV
jgi:hypothetical protein